MFKTRLQRNKEGIIGASIAGGLLLLFLINIAVLVPQIIAVYSPKIVKKDTTPIDIETVNNAVELLTK